MPQWDGIVQSDVQVVEPFKKLAYTWNALGLESVVVWTLLPTPAGTLLRMEQSVPAPIRNRPTRAPTTAGRNTSPISNVCSPKLDHFHTRKEYLMNPVPCAILRSFHIILSIPIIGYIYGRPGMCAVRRQRSLHLLPRHRPLGLTDVGKVTGCAASSVESSPDEPL